MVPSSCATHWLVQRGREFGGHKTRAHVAAPSLDALTNFATLLSAIATASRESKTTLQESSVTHSTFWMMSWSGKRPMTSAELSDPHLMMWRASSRCGRHGGPVPRRM